MPPPPPLPPASGLPCRVCARTPSKSQHAAPCLSCSVCWVAAEAQASMQAADRSAPAAMPARRCPPCAAWPPAPVSLPAPLRSHVRRDVAGHAHAGHAEQKYPCSAGPASVHARVHVLRHWADREAAPRRPHRPRMRPRFWDLPGCTADRSRPRPPTCPGWPMGSAQQEGTVCVQDAFRERPGNLKV